MVNKKPRKKKQDVATTEQKVVEIQMPENSIVEKVVETSANHINHRDLLPTGLYRQIQDLKTRIEAIEQELKNK